MTMGNFDDENEENCLTENIPTYKTFEGYEYGHIQFPLLFSREELESCQFIREHKNLILYGPVGTGKTHLAIAIGVKACQMGLKTKFYSVTELVLKLAEARKQGTLEKLVKDLQKAFEAGIKAAEEGIEYTKTIIATKGRASYLGERSIGHQDPGATSFTLMLKDVASQL